MTQKPNATTHIQLSQISKAYPNGVQALRDINLQIAQGEIFGIIGRSGAGKSTLLRLFNRLENADSGEITIHGEHTRHYSRSQLRDLRRRVAMIFQHFNLMATKTVAQNVELPLKMAGVPRAERQKRVAEILALVGLSDLRDSWPAKLSGGQKQRTGIARSSDGTMPLYFRTTPGANVPAGTYSDVLTITWVYRFCYVGLSRKVFAR